MHCIQSILKCSDGLKVLTPELKIKLLSILGQEKYLDMAIISSYVNKAKFYLDLSQKKIKHIDPTYYYYIEYSHHISHYYLVFPVHSLGIAVV